MAEKAIAQAFLENSIGTGFGVLVAILLYMLVRHVLCQQREILDMATQQNEKWLIVVKDMQRSQEVFQASVAQQHEKMLETQENTLKFLQTANIRACPQV